ncbi:hypothetical protein H7F15_14655 [Pontibacter sp. Tf4]|uniref:hypothetical protein n=1 Tax=Pontibacter sp. Tf4 TaxID=2761620 RepID=UPI0016257315|nr:hypothetical protein [Pontibacter sp. Tf4]MBB6612288.1 hypothetical protein [Pontibacter sp. Tf4]
MKTISRKIATLTLICAPLLFAACGGGEYGENAEMPPESQTGDTNESGVEGTGDQPGTAADDTTDYVNEVIGDDNAAAPDSL